MFLALTDDERQIVEATADALASEAPFERWFRTEQRAEEEERLFRFGVEMGWTGLAAPEAIGGAGGSIVDEALVFRQIGARLGPVALVASAVGVQIALASGETGLAGDILRGETRVALSAGDDLLLGSPGAPLALEASAGRLVEIGTAEPAADLDWGAGILRRTGRPGRVRAEDRASALRALLLVAAQLQGLAQTAVSESVAYAKLREQFGRPIGSFQAVRHRIADMEVRARRSEAQLYFAAVALRDGRSDATAQTTAAAATATGAASENTTANIAVHGAIGVTTDNIGHLLLKRALLWGLEIGSREALLDALAE